MSGPLAGVKVIDLTSMYSGPIAASILGDQGADVIKVEAPGGDPMRNGQPRRGSVGASFAMMNRNKRSVVLDLKQEEGRNLLLKLIQDADVLIENFRPGVADRLRIGYEELVKVNPQIIYAAISGFGAVGPYADRRVYDSIIQGISGIAHLHADSESGKPTIINTLICDKITSITAAQAVVSTLFSREQTGEGQKVEISMLDANLFFLWPDSMNNYSFVGDDVERVPYADLGRLLRTTADGYITVMPVQQKEWEGVFRALCREDLLEDKRFNDREERIKNTAALSEIINEEYARRTTDELCAALEREDVPFARINSRDDVVNDPQIKAMGALVEFEHDEGGTMRQPRPPGQFHKTPASLRRSSPALSAHTVDVLKELELTDEQVEILRHKGVIP